MLRILAVTLIAAGAVATAAPAASLDSWGESSFNVSWPSSGRSYTYRLTVPASRLAFSVDVDGMRLQPGVRYALTCPTFSSRSSTASWRLAAYGGGQATIVVTLTQGRFAWACLSGYDTGDVSEVDVDTYR